MSNQRPPLIIEPDELESRLGEPGLLVVDIGKADTYAKFHVPGAVHVAYAEIIAGRPPAPGALPPEEQLSRVLSAIGMTPETYVVAYDDEGGGNASRLLWTLEAVGHTNYSLLNGGLHAWANEEHPLDDRTTQPQASDYRARYLSDGGPVADADFILAHLDDPAVALLDARSTQEYEGTKAFASRAGHIPGAVNFEWTQAMDPERNLRLRPSEELRKVLAMMGIAPDKTVVTYCQTHHRSAYSYIMLRALGFERVLGYAGSWAEWGNRGDTPVEA